MYIRRSKSPSSALALRRKDAGGGGGRIRSAGRRSGCDGAAHGARQRRRKRVAGRADGEDGRLGKGRGVGHSGVGVRVEHVGDEMHDAVCEEDVGLDDLRRVDVLVVAGLADDERFGRVAGGVVGERLEAGAVCEGRGDEHLVGDDVVSHDSGDALGIHVLEGAADCGKGAVDGGKDGDVFFVGDLGHELAGVEGAQEVGHAEGLGGVLQSRGRHEQVVNHLDQAALESDVALGESAASAHAGGEDDVVAGLLGYEDVLPRRHVGVASAGQESWSDVGGTCQEGVCGDGSLKDVILQERHGGGFVGVIPHAVEGGVGDVFEGGIGGCNDL